jgi:hypothetical protein
MPITLAKAGVHPIIADTRMDSRLRGNDKDGRFVVSANESQQKIDEAIPILR